MTIVDTTTTAGLVQDWAGLLSPQQLDSLMQLFTDDVIYEDVASVPSTLASRRFAHLLSTSYWSFLTPGSSCRPHSPRRHMVPPNG
jgi:hypothetical protein